MGQPDTSVHPLDGAAESAVAAFMEHVGRRLYPGDAVLRAAMRAALEVGLKDMCSYVKEAAGDQSVLVPVSTLEMFNESAAHKLRQEVGRLRTVATDYRDALRQIRQDNSQRPRQIAAAVLTAHANWEEANVSRDAQAMSDPIRKRASNPTITCPICGLTSGHPMDVKEGYCGSCHAWTSAPCPATPQMFESAEARCAFCAWPAREHPRERAA